MHGKNRTEIDFYLLLTKLLRGPYQEPGKDDRYGNGRHAGRTHHNHLRKVPFAVPVYPMVVFAVRDQQLVLAGVFGEFQHFDVVAELDLGGFPPPEEVARVAPLQAPDRFRRGDGRNRHTVHSVYAYHKALDIFLLFVRRHLIALNLFICHSINTKKQQASLCLNSMFYSTKLVH